MSPESVDALLAESTAVAGWADDGTWSWRQTATTFELRGDLPPVTDPRHRELMVIGGAALLNVRVLIRVLGLHPAVQLLPDPTDPALIAIVRPEGLRVITSEDRLLATGIVLGAAGGTASAAEIPAATTPAVTDNVLMLLRRAAKVEHSWLALVPADELPRPYGRPAAGPPGGGVEAAVIGTVLDSPVARLQAGQAMQRALLTAAVNGVAARNMSAALTQPGRRAALRELIGGGLWPQAVLRLGDQPSS